MEFEINLETLERHVLHHTTLPFQATNFVMNGFLTLLCKGKGKVAPMYAVKVYGGVEV
jgi:hypothetical protein